MTTGELDIARHSATEPRSGPRVPNRVCPLGVVDAIGSTQCATNYAESVGEWLHRRLRELFQSSRSTGIPGLQQPWAGTSQRFQRDCVDSQLTPAVM